ncbi:M48 family metallopeptidase [Desulfuribacillus alkaliarsenatis]|uniref:YgjP-like metallopeptidase domain-containing protein n=1 Tax=Desulfuribacillus alkaliarsenatis TaxID=766136 RepID=A0A1E5G4I2_9FIRM|nr:SprT family zinc-dependent metalloprotease [Desulfuribacillus alkaliarsenatis]OEF97569.1 hypothetical protein BHF68_03900 [Desulfuribacillus alkaliarsenatis]
MEKHSVTYGTKEIQFQLIRKNIKNINLNVKPDMSISISASGKVPLDYIYQFVKEKAPWIVRNVGFFKEVQAEHTSIKEYVSGESFKYLGKQYRLKVIESDAEVESVKYYRGFIELKVKDKKNHAKKEKLVTAWFKEKAELNFADSLNRVYPIIEKQGVPKPEIQIRTMKARWGSCIKDKNIIVLNFELIKAPKFCIDYVVLHELIHFKYQNHDATFYELLTLLMPDWKQRKAILDEEVVREL